MKFLDLLLIAVGLSMDAFAVSIGKGISARKVTAKNALVTGLWFGVFQALMPLIGYLVIYFFSNIPAIQSVLMHVDHWIAFILLAFIGGRMLQDAFKKDTCEEKPDDSFSAKAMAVLAVATSIDALATGITFACLETSAGPVNLLHSEIWLDILVIGVTTFLFSVVGVLIGKTVGCRLHKGAQIFGGIVLIAIGLKILIEHLVTSGVFC